VSGPNSAWPTLWKALSVTTPPGPSSKRSTALRAAAIASMTSAPAAASTRPASVSARVRPLRRVSGAANSRCSAVRCCDTADGVTRNCSATAVTLPRAPSSRRMASW